MTAQAETDRMQHALSCSGWLQKRHPRNGKYQKRWFELHDGRLAYFKDDISIKPIKPPWDLLALRSISVPSTEDTKSSDAFDLVFLNRTITMRPHKGKGDSVESEAFARILQRLKPHKFDDGREVHRDAQGNELLVIHCGHCQTINGITMKSSTKRKTITCSACDATLKTSDAITQAELAHHYTQCPWCSATFRIDPGESAVVQTNCARCGENVRVVIDEERAREEELATERVQANDPALRIRFLELQAQLHENEVVMAELYHELTDLKKAIVRRCKELDDFEEPEYDHTWRGFMQPAAAAAEGVEFGPGRPESRRSTLASDSAPPVQRSRQALLALALLAREVLDPEHDAVASLLEDAFETASAPRRTELARDAYDAVLAAATTRSASERSGTEILLAHRLKIFIGATGALLHGERLAKTLFDSGLYATANEFAIVAERLQVANDGGRAATVALELRKCATFARGMAEQLVADRGLGAAGAVLGADAHTIAHRLAGLHAAAVGDRGQAILVELAVEARAICKGLEASGALSGGSDGGGAEGAAGAEGTEIGATASIAAAAAAAMVAAEAKKTLEDVLEEAALVGPRSRGATLQIARARVERIRKRARYQVSVLLFTVTFNANLAHSLTRSP